MIKQGRHILLMVASLVGLGCMPLPAQRGVFTDQEFDTMATEMAGDRVATVSAGEVRDGAILLDARQADEYSVSHIAGAERVGYRDFDLASIESSYDVNDTIIVYCSVGYRSGKVAEKLQKAGYRHVYNLKGGLFSWANEDRELVDESKQATTRVHGYNKKWAKWLKEEVPVTY